MLRPHRSLAAERSAVGPQAGTPQGAAQSPVAQVTAQQGMPQHSTGPCKRARTWRAQVEDVTDDGAVSMKVLHEDPEKYARPNEGATVGAWCAFGRDARRCVGTWQA